MKTVSQIIGWVDQVLPNAIDSTTKYVMLEDIFKSVKDNNTNYVVYDSTTPTASTQSTYSLPSGVEWSDLLYVGISGTTYNSTNVIGSTTPFTEYLYKNHKNTETGSQWWEYTSSSIRISTPSDAYHIQFKYLPNLVANASSDSTTVVNCNDALTDYLQHKLASMVARSGAFPRIDLANNYELEAGEKLTQAKIEAKKFRWRRINPSISYKAWW